MRVDQYFISISWQDTIYLEGIKLNKKIKEGNNLGPNHNTKSTAKITEFFGLKTQKITNYSIRVATATT